MANRNSKIEWCDASWNIVTGCDKVSEGCTNCYAETFAERWRGIPGHAYEQGFDLRLWPERLLLPLRWTKPTRIFVNSMSDLWHAKVPDDFLIRALAVMALAPRHTFMILTKRPQRMHRFLSQPEIPLRVQLEAGRMIDTGEAPKGVCRDDADPNLWPFENVWLGVSVESQEVAWRVDWLTRTPAPVRFLSCEPLLGPLDLDTWLWNNNPCTPGLDDGCPDTRREVLHWVIAGGESGPGARPMHPDWARSLRDQCQDAGVPYFFKQWGEWIEVDGPRCRKLNQEAARKGVWMLPDGTVIPRTLESNRSHSPYGTSIMARLGKHRTGRELDGRTWDEFPQTEAVYAR